MSNPEWMERGSMAGTEDGVSRCGGCVIREPWGFLLLSVDFLLGGEWSQQTRVRGGDARRMGVPDGDFHADGGVPSVFIGEGTRD
jgi:hypothetical protein